MESAGSVNAAITFLPISEATVVVTLPSISDKSCMLTGCFRASQCLLCRPRRFCKVPYISCLPAALLAIFVLVALVLIQDYLKLCLLWLDSQEEWVVCSVFLVLYTAVSFPLTWGYVLLNLACGYHFGLWLGTLVTAVAATLGIAFAHVLMKHCFMGILTSRLLKTNLLRSTLLALESSHAFRLIAVCRLTPIPFGLQNALFAISPICLWQYIVASALGLFPTQVIGVYLGTTVRSMEEVFIDEGTATFGYTVLFAQVLLSISLMIFILRNARQQLTKAVGSDLPTVKTLQESINWKSSRSFSKCLPFSWNKKHLYPLHEI